MRKVTLLAFAAAVMTLLTGCFSTSWIIDLQQDGSGTLEMEYRIDTKVIEMMQSMGDAEDGNTPQSSADLIDREEMETLAANMGEGVRYVSAEPLPESGEFFGYRALFEFDDINTLGIDPMEGAPEQEPGEMGGGPEENGEEEPAPFTFSFTPGRTAELVVMMAQDEEDETDADSADAGPESESDPQEDQAMAQMMKPYFRTMSFLVQVKVQGNIRETNASYRDGNTITLMDMDMAKIIDDQELFSKVVNSESMNDEQMLAKLEKAGVRIEQKERITVTFR